MRPGEKDGPHRILCALHSWGGFPDLCAVSVDLGRQAPRHRPPSGGTQESARGAAAPAIPCPFTKARSRRHARSKRRCEARPSRSTQIRDLTDECCGGPGHASIGKNPRASRVFLGTCRGWWRRPLQDMSCSEPDIFIGRFSSWQPWRSPARLRGFYLWGAWNR